MFEDADPPKRKQGPRPLDTLSIAELEEYIADMETEIARVRLAIEAKRSHAEAAAAFFKK